MIRITYKDTGKKRKLTVEGHAGGENGKDIFCAAASTLVITLRSTLLNAGIRYREEISDGFAEIRCNKPESRTVFYTCVCGFYTLAQMYPDYYEIKSV